MKLIKVKDCNNNKIFNKHYSKLKYWNIYED